MTARPIRYQRQVSDRNGKNFLHFYYFFITHKQIIKGCKNICFYNPFQLMKRDRFYAVSDLILCYFASAGSFSSSDFTAEESFGNSTQSLL